MKSATISGGAFATVLLVLVLAEQHQAFEQDVDARPATASSVASTKEVNQGFLYGRVTSDDGATYEGRLRFGGDEEAFWGDYFNGAKKGNPWAVHVERESAPVEIFGFAIGDRDTSVDRQFMARFGDIARIDAPVTGRFFQLDFLRGRELRVTLKSGTVVHLDRFAADDFADGVRVWDVRRGVVDLEEWQIRSIEFLPAGRIDAAPGRLHGTVHTAHGDFTGSLQWDRKESVGSDVLVGRTAGREERLRFDMIRSIERRSRNSSLVTLLDGRELALFGSREGPEVAHGHRGIYVDDRRYGRVLVSWDAFERIDFSTGGSGPAYSDFPRGRPLTGSVTTRTGRRLTGRVVYDLDESETTETLDAPRRGIDYNIPFGLIASVTLKPAAASVTFHSGEELQVERSGDLGEGNAGMLMFGNGRERPEYVQWSDVQKIDFDQPPVMYPPRGAPR